MSFFPSAKDAQDCVAILFFFNSSCSAALLIERIDLDQVQRRDNLIMCNKVYNAVREKVADPNSPENA
ncbi:hypothetical protein [Chryseobacterium daeguense]|uniref:hypothetical protein n=1 Tax=Chryseobacterium daeguense TaxID=412438 RepID=UPI001E2AD3BA|nr:hypothetical protein [Chryseobacterium daeguense]